MLLLRKASECLSYSTIPVQDQTRALVRPLRTSRYLLMILKKDPVLSCPEVPSNATMILPLLPLHRCTNDPVKPGSAGHCCRLQAISFLDSSSWHHASAQHSAGQSASQSCEPSLPSFPRNRQKTPLKLKRSMQHLVFRAVYSVWWSMVILFRTLHGINNQPTNQPTNQPADKLNTFTVTS